MVFCLSGSHYAREQSDIRTKTTSEWKQWCANTLPLHMPPHHQVVVYLCDIAPCFVYQVALWMTTLHQALHSSCAKAYCISSTPENLHTQNQGDLVHTFKFLKKRQHCNVTVLLLHHGSKVQLHLSANSIDEVTFQSASNLIWKGAES